MPREKRKGKKKAGSITVDMDGVSSRALLPEGEYPVRVKGIELKTSDNSGKDYLEWEFETFDTGDEKLNGVTLYYMTSLQPKALFNLRGLLEAMGVDVPDGPMDIEFDELEDEEVLAIVRHEEWEGKPRHKMKDYAPLGERGDDEKVSVSEEDDDEDEDDKKSKKGKKGKKPPKISAEELGDMDVDELEDVVNTYELEVDLDDYKTAKKKINAVKEALDEADFLED